MAAFGLAALVMAGLMFGLASLIGLAQEGVVAALRAQTHQVRRWGGWVLMLAGLWLAALGIWAGFFAQLFEV